MAKPITIWLTRIIAGACIVGLIVFYWLIRNQPSPVQTTYSDDITGQQIASKPTNESPIATPTPTNVPMPTPTSSIL